MFGLNALGGSVNVQLKNGFTWQGFEAECVRRLLRSDPGRVPVRQAGRQRLDLCRRHAAAPERLARSAVVGSAELLRRCRLAQRARRTAPQRHWRRIPCSTVLAPPRSSCSRSRPSAQFTAPNQISNQYAAVSLTGSVDVTDTTSVQAAGLLPLLPAARHQRQRAERHALQRRLGAAVLGWRLQHHAGRRLHSRLPERRCRTRELDNQTTNTNAYGASAQVTNTNELFGLKNHFVAGVSFDGAQTMFSAVSFVGGLTPLDRVFIGPGVVIDEPGTNSPVARRDLQRDLRRLRRRHAEPHAAACSDAVRPVQRGADRSERSERRRSDRQSQLHRISIRQPASPISSRHG